jgi:hypothetical protein
MNCTIIECNFNKEGKDCYNGDANFEIDACNPDWVMTSSHDCGWFEQKGQVNRSSNYGTERMGWTHIFVEIHAYGDYKEILHTASIITNKPKDKFIGLYHAVRKELKLTLGLSGRELAVKTMATLEERNYLRIPNSADTYVIKN